MSITSLPTEVICMTCSYLQRSEEEMLRLSCRILYNKSFDHFFDRYFKSIRFIATSDSLRELEDLASSDDIRKRVQELWMIPTVFEGFHDRTLDNMGELSVSSKSCRPAEGEELKARWATYKAMVADSRNLLESEEAFVNRLRKCLERFPNIKTIGLAHYTTTFLLDPRQQKVRFLGWRHLISQIDFHFTHGSLSWLRGTASRVSKVNSLALSRILQALSESGRQIKKLHTCNADYCADIGPGIALTGAQYNSLLPVLDSLEDLHLCIAVENMTWLNLITTVAPHLERLTLSDDQNTAYTLRPSRAGDFYQRLELNRLRELHLHQIHITSHSLKSMLTKSKGTLNHLTLFEVTLVPDEGDGPPCVDSTPTSYCVPPDLGSSFSMNFHPSGSPYSPYSPSASLPPTSPYYDPPSPPDFSQALHQPTQDLYFDAFITPVGPPSSAPYTPSTTYAELRAGVENIPWKVLWDSFGEELSLQRYSIGKVSCGSDAISIKNIDDLTEPTEYAEFNAETDGLSFREWIKRLSPVRDAFKPSTFSSTYQDQGTTTMFCGFLDGF